MILISLALALAQVPKISHVEIPMHENVVHFMRAGWPNLVTAPDGKGTRRPPLLNEQTMTGVTVKADVVHNRLVLDGPEDKLSVIQQTVAFFDVVPRKINISVDCASAYEGLSFASQATIDNQTTWQSNWDELKEVADVRPRINEDGTVTIYLQVTYQGRKSSAVGRVKNGAAFTFVAPSNQNYPLTSEADRGLDIKVKAQIVESAGT